VWFLPEAEAERSALTPQERRALTAAVDKLVARGEQLGFPHTSAVQIAEEPLRELRPRAGHSRFRAFYRRVGTRMVIAGIGPEAAVDPRGFERAVRAATDRLARLTGEE